MGSRSPLRAAPLACTLLACATLAPPVAGQLRPLEPMDWRAFEPGTVVLARLGGGIFLHQRASIGQVEGLLIEAPGAVLSWTTGDDARVVLRAIVHPRRILQVDSSFGTPLAGATRLDSPIVDAGDNAVEAVVRLTPGAPTDGALAALRYGVRLPTHNHRKGLDRHKTDFYAMLGGRVIRGAVTLAGEGGAGIWGTQAPGYEKVVPFLYEATASWRAGAVEPSLALVGQAMASQVRGNENLSELRAGMRVGHARFLEATVLRGLARYGPRWGVLVFAGVSVP